MFSNRTRKVVLGRPFGPLLASTRKLRNRHFLLADIFFLALAPAASLWIRLDGGADLVHYLPSLLAYTLGTLLLRLVVFHRMGLYNRFWRYATVDELYQIALAVFLGSVLIGAVFYSPLSLDLPGMELPRSVPFIEALLVLLAVGSVRFSVRLAEGNLRQSLAHTRGQNGAARVLIMGAGIAGQMVARELLSNPELKMVPVGFLDDDTHKQGVKIMGLPVLGDRGKLPEVVRAQRVSQVIIAMPRASGQSIRELRDRCEAAGVSAKTVPAMFEILQGSVGVTQLRPVQIEDLVRRERNRTDIGAVEDYLCGRRVLVTGGGGSIGSELCRQILRCWPAEIILVGHGENSIFETANELQRLIARMKLGGSRNPIVLRTYIADVRSADRVDSIMRTVQPHVIFHAAAHKHVPLMEANVSEAVTNNVFGTENLLNAALEYGVERFVMISSDKAVNPTSVMGASKRAAELLVLEAARKSGKPYVAVRFGNVLGSRGSVVLTFKRQIAEGGPVTVSDPAMTRFFMTIPEAVQLVLQAAVLGDCGEVFVLDMGQPVRIVDLARDLIELSGLQVGRDIEIAFTGVRPGEKLYEELFVEGERYEPTCHEKVLIAANASTCVPGNLREMMADLRWAAERDNAEETRRCLARMIPEFRHEALGPPVELPDRSLDGPDRVRGRDAIRQPE